MKSLSIVRYLTDNMTDLPLSVTTRMVRTHDLPVMMVKFIQEKPWIRTRKAKVGEQVFQGNDWTVYARTKQMYDQITSLEIFVFPRQDVSDPYQVQKLEGQCWMSLYNLLSKPISSEKYELNDYRRGILLKLLPLITAPLESQLPFLKPLKKWLLQLQLGQVPAAKTLLLIETVAEIREGLVQR